MSTFTHVTKVKRMTCVLATISTLTFPGPFMSTSPAAAERLFYVSPSGDDSNPGIEEAPWKTIGKAARTLVSGDTAIVMDGTYTEGEIVFRNSGTASEPITLRAQNKHLAILSSTSGCSPNISISASHVTIEGLRSSISASNVPCSSVNSASGTAVRCWSASTPSTSNQSSGHVGCKVRGMLIDASPARGHGVKTNQDFSLVENCVSYSGIEAFNNTGTIFRNNIVLGSDAWGTSLVAKGGVRNFQAYNNRVHIRSAWGYGIVLGGASGSQWLYDPPSGLEAYNSVAYNNVVLNENGSTAYSIGMRGAKDSAIFNNVMIGGYLFLSPGYSGSPSMNPTVKNNIFTCLSGNVLGQWNYTGTLSADYNNFYNCSASPTQIHPIIGNPLFIDSQSDWHLTSGSPAIGKGTPIQMNGFNGEIITVNMDRDGKVRTVPWDLGIYAMNGAIADTTAPARPIIVRIE